MEVAEDNGSVALNVNEGREGYKWTPGFEVCRCSESFPPYSV